MTNLNIANLISNPEKMGSIEYLCQVCGKDSRIVPMSCKSTFCLRCSKVYVDDWVSQVTKQNTKQLHEGVIYRHIVLTMPEGLRPLFYNKREELYGELFQCGVNSLDEFYSVTSGKELTGGYILVLQTHGRNGQYNPHLHIIGSSGGLDKANNKWEHLDYMPYRVLHKKWQWHLLEMLKRKVSKSELGDVVDRMYRKYPKGFVSNVQKGEVPSRYHSLAKYIAKYVVSPPISLRRIDAYDGRRVRYHYKSHLTEQMEEEEVDVYTFIGRMIQHVLAKGFQRVRYYGVQATKSYAKYKGIIQESLLKVGKVVKGAIKIISPKNYRQRYQESTGNDPFLCSSCGAEMEVWKIWHPGYGIIYHALDKILSGGYEQKKEVERDESTGGCAVRSTPRNISITVARIVKQRCR